LSQKIGVGCELHNIFDLSSSPSICALMIPLVMIHAQLGHARLQNCKKMLSGRKHLSILN